MEWFIVYFGFSQMRDRKEQKEVPQIFDSNIFVTFSLTINSNCGKLNRQLEIRNNNYFWQSRLFENF